MLTSFFLVEVVFTFSEQRNGEVQNRIAESRIFSQRTLLRSGPTQIDITGSMLKPFFENFFGKGCGLPPIEIVSLGLPFDYAVGQDDE
ncbi:MAG: hypothetical protein V9G98_13020 [Candidatus Competibacter sp.]